MFYRPARQEDFDKYIEKYSFVLRGISRATKELVLHDMEKAIKSCMKDTGRDRHECHQACQIYNRYATAKMDFDNNITVYVGY